MIWQTLSKNGIKNKYFKSNNLLDWVDECTSGEYKNWLEKNYKDRK